MNILRKSLRLALAAGLGSLLSFASHALTTEQAYAMAAADDSEQRVLAINQAVLAPDAQTDGGRLSAYLGGPTQLGDLVMLQYADGRRLPEIAAEFDELDWLERIDEDQGNKHFAGYTRLNGISRNGGNVLVELAKEG